MLKINDKLVRKIYSIYERVIGKWIDGKPIYEKTMVIPKSSFSSSGSLTYIHNINNIDKIVGYEGIIERNSGNIHTFNTLPWLAGTSTDAANWNSCINDINTSEINFNLGRSTYTYGLLNVYITLRYTKTTD